MVGENGAAMYMYSNNSLNTMISDYPGTYSIYPLVDCTPNTAQCIYLDEVSGGHIMACISSQDIGRDLAYQPSTF
jgi:hypothetical protein